MKNHTGNMAVCGVPGDVPIIYLYGTPYRVAVERVSRFVEYCCRLEKTTGCGDRVYVPDRPLQVWDGTAWTALNTVTISGQRAPAIRLVTRCGAVCVTAETPVFLDGGEAVAAGELQEGDELEHAVMPPPSPSWMKYCWPHVHGLVGYFYGVLFHVGSFVKCWHKERGTWRWEFRVVSRRRAFLDHLKEAGDAYMKMPPEETAFHIRAGRQGYHVLYMVGDVEACVRPLRNIIYTEDEERCVPREVFNGSLEMQEGYFKGYMEVAGDKWVQEHRPSQLVLVRSAVGALGFLYVAACLDYVVTVAECKTARKKQTTYTYRLRMSPASASVGVLKRARKPSLYAVHQLEPQEGEGSDVYGFRTESGKIMLGVGLCVVRA